MRRNYIRLQGYRENIYWLNKRSNGVGNGFLLIHTASHYIKTRIKEALNDSIHQNNMYR